MEDAITHRDVPIKDEWRDADAREQSRLYAHLLWFSGAFSNPLLGFRPGLVQSQEASLSTALDELIGLCDELGIVDP